MAEKRPLPSAGPLIMGCWKGCTGYRPNIQLFARSGCSPDLNHIFMLDTPSLLTDCYGYYHLIVFDFFPFSLIQIILVHLGPFLELVLLYLSTLQVVQLMILDCKRAVSLLIHHRDVIAPSEVVSQLLGASKKCNHKYFLHLYLRSLFEASPNAGREFHDLQVIFYLLHSCHFLMLHNHVNS